MSDATLDKMRDEMCVKDVTYHAAYRSYAEAVIASTTRPPRIRIKWQHRHGSWRSWFTSHGWPGGFTYHLGPIKVCCKVYDYREVTKELDEWGKQWL